MSFGAGTLSLHSIDEQAGDLGTIGTALGERGALMLWSCQSGQGERGAAFVEALAHASGATVAAAMGLIGAAARGGEWKLDAYSNARVPLTTAGAAAYAGVMALPPGPSITSVTDDVLPVTGTLTNGASTNDNNLTVNVSLIGTGAAAGSTIQLYNGTGTASQLGTSYTLTAADITNGFANVQTGGLNNGTTYVITARVTEVSGQSGASASFTVIEDQTAPNSPSTPVLAPASDSGTKGDKLTNVATPTFTGTAEANSTVKLFDGATQIGSGIADASGNWSIISSALSQGTHNNINATATDAAGNVSGLSAGLQVTIDTTALPPGTPDLQAASDTGPSNTDNVTKVTTPTFSGTGVEANSTVTLFDGATQIGSAKADGSGIWNITSSTLGQGTHSITATQTDLAGNVSAASSALSVTIDTTAPTVSTVTASPPTADLGAGKSVTLNFVLSEAVTVSGTPTLSLNTGNNGLATYQSGSGTNTLTFGYAVRAGDNSPDLAVNSTSIGNGGSITDTAGNAVDLTGALVNPAGTLQIDTTAPNQPSAPVLAPASDGGIKGDGITNVNTPSFTGTAEANSTVTISSDGTTVGSGVADGSGNYSVATSALTNGTHLIKATATDGAGNVSGLSSGINLTIDTTAPLAPSTPDLTAASDLGTSNTDNITSVTKPVFTGTGENGATVTLFDGATAIGTGTVNGSGIWTITATTALTEGANTLTATQTDVAGNVSVASAGLPVAIHTTAALALPHLTAGSDSGVSNTDNITNVATPTFTGTAWANSTVTLSDGATVLGTGTADASGNWTIVSSGLSQGSHNITAKAADGAGFSSGASPVLSVTIDTTAPGTPTIGAIGGVDSVVSGQAGDNTVSGTAEAGATVTVRSGANTLGTATADGFGNWTYALSPANLTTLGQGGGKTLTATATDAAGNTSGAAAPFSFGVDTVAPSVQVLSTVGGVDDVVSGQAGDNAVSGAAEAGATVTVRSGGNTLGTATADSFGNWTYALSPANLTTLGQGGGKTLTATATDAAGNTSGAATSPSFAVDTVAPSVPVLSTVGGVDGVVSGQTGDNTVSGTAEAGATVTVRSGANTLGTATADGFGNWTYALSPANLTTLGQGGGKTLTATATDAAGNTSGAAAPFSFGVDTVAPSVPVLSTVGGVDGVVSGQTGDNTVSGTAEAGATVTVRSGANTLGTATADSGGNWTYALSPANLTTLGQGGGKTLTATATDAAGNTSGAAAPFSFGVDTVAPSVPVLSTVGGVDDVVSGQAGDNAVSGTAEAGATVTVSSGANTLGTATADSGGNWTYALSPANLTTLGQGSQTATATATDTAGNTSGATAPFGFSVDTVAPPITEALAHDTGASNSDSITSDATLVGSGDPNAVVNFTEGGVLLATTVADGTGAWTVTPFLPDGPHTIIASETDAAGNLASASLDFTLVTPITESLATDTGIAGDLITADPTLTGSAKPNVLLTLTEGGQVLGTATADGSGIWSFRPVGLADGAHTIVVGNDLNVAIQGTGFFQIQLPDGEIAYTHDGGFTLAATGQLVTTSGDMVLPGITIPNGALAVTIDDTGAVQVLLAGQPAPIQVGNIQIATFANEAGLVPLGGGLFQASANSGAPVTGSPGSPGFGTISQAETASLSFTLDTSAAQPANHLAHDTGVSQTDAVTSDATLTGLAAPNETLVFTEGTSILGTTTADAAGIWTFVPPNLADGTHVIAAGDSQDLNLAVQGNGYFQIQLPSGEIAYTRDGSFSLSATGQLVTADGNVVQPGITIPSGALAVTIDDTGTVRALLDGQPTPVQLGTIQLAIFANQAGLTPLGGNLFQASPASGAPEVGSPGSSGIGSVMQLGMSDVNFTLVTPITESLATDTGIAGDLITADPTLTGSAKPNVLLTLTEGGQVLGTATADGSGIWSFRPVGLADGAHTIVVGNDLNVAIQGTGFFQIQLPDGEIAYTHDGGFTLAATGQLVTTSGDMVLPGITIPNGALAVTIDDTGAVQVLLAGQPAPIQVGNIQIATFANEAGLVPLGGGLFQASANSGAPVTGSPGSPGFGTISQAETASLSFTLDTSAAQPANHLAHDTGVSQTDAVTSDATLTGLAAPNETLVFTEGTSILGTTTADAAGIWTFVPPNLADGTHVIAAGDSQDLNLAVQGNGYFQIQLPSGEIAYTRDGSFSLSATGQLVTADGNVVQPGITIPSGALAVTIDDTGTVRALLDGQPTPVQLGTIQLAIFANQAGLTPLGGNLFQASPASGAPEVGSPGSSGIGSVMQLGMSNVSFTLDTQGPAIPTIQGLAPGSDSGIDGDGITNVAQPTVVGTADAGSIVVLSDGAVQVGSAIADPVSGAWSIIASTLSDGEHLLTATSSDPAGNVSPASAPLDVTIDTIAPPVTEALAFDTGASSSDGITSDATLVGSGDPNAVVALTEGGSQFATTVADGTGAWTFTPSLPDGPHTIVASETDIAGNLASASLDVTLLTQGPAIPTIQGLAPGNDSGIDGDGITNVAQPTVVGTADAGSTIVLSDGAVQVGSAIADPVSGAWSIIASTLSDGEHFLTATSSDPAGNVSPASAPLDVTIDTIAPPVTEALALDTGASSSDGITSDATLVGAGDPNAVVALTEGGVLLATTVADGTGAWTFTPSLPDGPHTIVASETDTAGNLASASLDVTLLTQGPAIPTIQGLAPGSDSGVDGDGITNVAQPTVVGTADAGSTIVLFAGAVQVGSAIADPVSGAWSIVASTLSDGEHLLTATSSDPAGNVSLASGPLDVTIDTTAPTVAAVTASPTSGDLAAGSTVALTVELDEAVTVAGGTPALTLNSGGSASYVSGSGTSSLVFSYTVGAGENAADLTVTGVDLNGATVVDAGNNPADLSAAAVNPAGTLQIDTTPPNAPGTPDLLAASDSGASDTDNITNVTAPVITGTGGEDGATVTLFDGGTSIGTGTVAAGGIWSITTSILAEGPHTITATQTDAAGNTSAASAALSVIVDTAAPNSWIDNTADWKTATDWSSGTVPASIDDVLIAASGTYTVTLSAGEAQSVNTLIVDAAGATLSLQDRLSVTGGIAVDAGTLDVSNAALFGEFDHDR